MSRCTFLTSHAQALLLIAHQSDARLRDLAAAMGVTERTAFGVVSDLVADGYVVKQKDGRRNSYRILEHLPLPDSLVAHRTIGEVLDLLVDATEHDARSRTTR